MIVVDGAGTGMSGSTTIQSAQYRSPNAIAAQSGAAGASCIGGVRVLLEGWVVH